MVFWVYFLNIVDFDFSIFRWKKPKHFVRELLSTSIPFCSHLEKNLRLPNHLDKKKTIFSNHLSTQLSAGFCSHYSHTILHPKLTINISRTFTIHEDFDLHICTWKLLCQTWASYSTPKQVTPQFFSRKLLIIDKKTENAFFFTFTENSIIILLSSKCN